MTPDEAPEHGRGVTLVSRGRSGSEPVYQALGDDSSEASAIAMWVESRHSAGIPWSEIAVLYRINSQASHLEAAFAERSIPYLVKGSERFYERREVRRTLDALVRIVADEPGADALPAFDRLLVSQGWTTAAPQGEGEVRQRWESLQALRDLAASAVEEGTATLADLATVFSRRAATQEAPVGDGVTLATLHASKGLEWDVVALYGMSDAMVPFIMAETPVEIASERRLLHVGVTRARRDLWVSYSWSGSDRDRQGISRFLRGLPGTGNASTKPPRHRKRRATVAVCSAWPRSGQIRWRDCCRCLVSADARPIITQLISSRYCTTPPEAASSDNRAGPARRDCVLRRSYVPGRTSRDRRLSHREERQLWLRSGSPATQ